MDAKTVREFLATVTTPTAFQELRMAIDTATYEDAQGLLAARTVWFDHAVSEFKNKFVTPACQAAEKSTHIPYLPIDGPDTLVMTLNVMSTYLNPNYLGKKGHAKMLSALKRIIGKLITSRFHKSLKEEWRDRLSMLKAGQAWQTGPAYDQLTAPDQPTTA